MLRKLIALAAVVAFVLVLPTLTAATGTGKAAPHTSGTIMAWDGAAKQFTVKNTAGTETSFGWTEKTTVVGTPKVGEHASVSYMKDKDGKLWATQISIGAKTATTKPSVKK